METLLAKGSTITQEMVRSIECLFERGGVCKFYQQHFFLIER